MKALQFLSRLIFPSLCLSCRRLISENQDDLCPDCDDKVRPVREPGCSICGKPFPEGAQAISHACSPCLKESPPFSLHRSLYVYGDVVSSLIHRFKYFSAFSVMALMSRRATRIQPALFDGIDVIVPIPLSKKRLKTRMYNQSLEWGKTLSRLTGIPVSPVLVKIRETEAQTALDRTQRLHNLNGAFALKGDLHGKTVLLLDDVFTTGSTMMECGRVLIKGGVKEVRGLTMAMNLKRQA